MGRSTSVTFSCDKCGKRLKTCNNTMDIVTELSEKWASFWRRLHVRIVLASGMHNDGEEEGAELCRSCATAILTDALKRVKAGERASAGVEDSDQNNWE